MLAEYLEKKDREANEGDTVRQASEDRGIGYCNRPSRSPSTAGNREIQRWEFLRQEFMEKLQGAASEVWRSLKLKEGMGVGRDWPTLTRDIEARSLASSIGGRSSSRIKCGC